MEIDTQELLDLLKTSCQKLDEVSTSGIDNMRRIVTVHDSLAEYHNHILGSLGIGPTE